jgi:hypothetical protein
LRAFVGYYRMNTSSCRVMKSERYDTEEESSRLGFEKSARGGGWVVLEADFKGDAGGPQT